MGGRVIPDPAEIRDQIHRLRDDIANWRIPIENARARIARLSGYPTDSPPRADERPLDERPRDRHKPTGH